MQLYYLFYIGVGRGTVLTLSLANPFSIANKISCKARHYFFSIHHQYGNDIRVHIVPLLLILINNIDQIKPYKF